MSLSSLDNIYKFDDQINPYITMKNNSCTNIHKVDINALELTNEFIQSYKPSSIGKKTLKKPHILTVSTTRIKDLLSHYNIAFNIRTYCSKKLIIKKLKRLKLDKCKKRKIKAFFMCWTIEQVLTSSDHSEKQVIMPHTSKNDNNGRPNQKLERKSQYDENDTNHHKNKCNNNHNIATELNSICNVCLAYKTNKDFVHWISCKHDICIMCAVNYIYQEITVNYNDKLCCHQCTNLLHPNEIKNVLLSCEINRMDMDSGLVVSMTSKQLYEKYEKICLERTLILIPNIRFCPGKNCSNAVIADNCEDCPKIKCQNKNCGISFCFHCKSKWHPQKNCIEAISSSVIKSMNLWPRNYLNKLYGLHKSAMSIFSSLKINLNVPLPQNISSINNNLLNTMGNNNDDVRLCPTCRCVVVKENDGKCNLVTCNMCKTTFCWLCMQPTTDKHYFIPNGCTYFGKRKWNSKITFCWRIALMTSSPLWISCIVAFLMPITMLVLPAYCSSVIYAKMRQKYNKFKSNTASGCTFCLLSIFSPILYVLLISMGIPLALFYTYVQIPTDMWKDRYSLHLPPYKKTIRHKLSLSHIQEQLFLIHIQWGLSELAQVHENLEKMSSTHIRDLLSEFFENQIKSVTINIDEQQTVLEQHDHSILPNLDSLHKIHSIKTKQKESTLDLNPNHRADCVNQSDLHNKNTQLVSNSISGDLNSILKEKIDYPRYEIEKQNKIKRWYSF